MDSDYYTARGGGARKKLPPYGRDLIARVEAARRRGSFHPAPGTSIDGRHTDLIVYVGPDGFRRARRESRLHLTLPLGDDPAGYRWPVQHHPCGIVWCGDDHGPVDGAAILALGHELVAAGASLVVDLQSGGRIDG